MELREYSCRRGKLKRLPNPEYYEERECLHCGKTFWVAKSRLKKRGQGQYCSRQCLGEAKKKNPQERECPTCGKKFWVLKSQLKWRPALYCSVQCKAKAKENKILCSCKVCGKEFYAVPADVKRGQGQYCSKECAVKGTAERQKKREVEIICPDCQKRFWVSKSYLGYHNPKFCSLSCKKEYIRKQRTRKCDSCGNEFQVASLYEAERMGGRFCSRECMFKGLSPTTIELLLYGALRQAGVRYIPQHFIRLGNTTTFVDAYLPTFKACIFADGVYWHSLKHINKRDKLVQNQLEQKGYKVFRMSETKMKNNLAKSINNIFRTLEIPNLLTDTDIEPIERWKAKEEIARARKLLVPCKVCGREFSVPRRMAGTVKYCSVECKDRAREVTKVSVSCKVCGKEFFVLPLLAHIVKYCSAECKDRATEARKKECKTCGKLFLPQSRGKGRPSDKAKYCSKKCATEGMKKYIQCHTCGKTFRPKLGGRKYCSRACSNIANRKPRTEHIIRWCIQCGKEINLPIGTAQKTNKLFCSRECQVDYYYSKNKEQCLNCGESFRKAHPWTKFCSRNCYDAYRAMGIERRPAASTISSRG